MLLKALIARAHRALPLVAGLAVAGALAGCAGGFDSAFLNTNPQKIERPKGALFTEGQMMANPHVDQSMQMRF